MIEAVLEKIGAHPCAVFLDYDGTLSPIVDHPDDAVLSSTMCQTLEVLRGRMPIALVSGRALHDVQQRVAMTGVDYAGNHGFEIGRIGEPLLLVKGLRTKAAIRRVKAQLSQALGEIPNHWIEDKGLSLSIHYRRVDPKWHEQIYREVINAAQCESRVKVHHGKMVLEVRPHLRWDKGEAVAWLRTHWGAQDRLPVYIGDDLTDECAFAKVNALGGISIYVGTLDKKTKARYALASVDEVQTFLARLGEKHASNIGHGELEASR